MKRLLFFNILLFALLLAACAAPPTKVSSSPTVQNTTTPTQTPRPTPTITIALTGARSLTAAPDRRKVDPGLVYGEPCKAPCWFGLIPGKTTAQEISEVVPRLGTIESPYDITQGDGIIPYIFQTRPDIDGGMSVALKMGRDKKVLEAIDSSALNFGYSLGQLIAQFGEPEAVYDMYVVDAKRSCAEVVLPSKATTAHDIEYILYPQQGLLFAVITPIGDMLCTEMQVNSFCYYSPMSMQEALMNNHLANLCDYQALEEVTEKDLIEWHGFGSGY